MSDSEIPAAEGRAGRSRSRPPGGFVIGRMLGIDIEIDSSWIFIFVLVTWSLASGFSTVHRDWSPSLRLATAFAASLLFFASVLAHELCHCVVARARGLPVHRITLFLFGGVSNLEREPASAATEFFMALVGPLSSLLIGAVFSVLGTLWVGVDYSRLGEPASMLARIGPIPTLLLWLGPINILLGIFNLIPGFPLDGGRILRSILWAATKDLQRATRWAASVGQLIGWLFIFAGISIAFGASIPLLGAGVVNGLWFAFIGWFLLNAATASRSRVMIDHLLEDLQVSRLMRREIPRVPGDMPLGTLVYDRLLGTDERSFAVFDGAMLLGSVSLEDVRKIPRDKWDSTPVREVMTPASQLGPVGPRDQAGDAYRELIERGLNQVPVVEDGRLLGFFRRSDVARWLELQHR